MNDRTWGVATDRPNPKAKSPNKCGCRGHTGPRKTPYRTRESALSAAITLATRVGGSWRPYECPSRLGWHLTTGEPRDVT